MRAMALAGESALAEESREQFSLSKDMLDIDSAEAAAQRAVTADMYLPLQLSAEALLFVDDECAIPRLVCCQSDRNPGVLLKLLYSTTPVRLGVLCPQHRL